MSLPTDRAEGDIVDPQDINAIAVKVNEMSGRLSAPVFDSRAAALAYEERNPGATAFWYDDGSIPTILTTTFDVAHDDIHATFLEGRQWQSALEFTLSNSQRGRLRIMEGEVRAQGTTAGGAAVVDAQGEADWVVSCQYNVNAADSQVRLLARGNRLHTGSDRETMPVQGYIRADGEVRFEPYWTGAAWGALVLGTGYPKTGVLSLEVFGDMAVVKVNAVKVGATQQLLTPQLAPSHIGFGLLYGARVLSFQAETL